MAQQPKRPTLAGTVATNDYRASLEALRDVLAQSVEQVEPDKRAPLAKQLAEVLTTLKQIPDKREQSTTDDLAAKRAARRAQASVSTGTGKPVKRRSGSDRASS